MTGTGASTGAPRTLPRANGTSPSASTRPHPRSPVLQYPARDLPGPSRQQRHLTRLPSGPNRGQPEAPPVGVNTPLDVAGASTGTTRTHPRANGASPSATTRPHPPAPVRPHPTLDLRKPPGSPAPLPGPTGATPGAATHFPVSTGPPGCGTPRLEQGPHQVAPRPARVHRGLAHVSTQPAGVPPHVHTPAPLVPPHPTGCSHTLPGCPGSHRDSTGCCQWLAPRLE